MLGNSPFGDSPFGSPLPPWRGIVESSPVIGARVDAIGTGNPIAQGRSATAADVQTTVVATAIASAGSAIVTGAADVAAKGVVVIESGAAITAPGAIAPTTAVVIQSSTAITGKLDGATVGGAIAQSSSAVTAEAGPQTRAVAIGASGATIVTAKAALAVESAASEAPPTKKVVEPNLQPLVESHEADTIEEELKALFKQMFDENIRPNERFMNVLGMPQHGPRELVEQSLAADGLSIYRGADTNSGAGAYLLRAWRAMNPKRGTHLLETYLQLLWPNVWTATQMWQRADIAYPTQLVEEEADAHYLTSRLEVTLPARVTTGGDVNAITSGLRASLPARMLMNMSIVEQATVDMGVAVRYYAGAVVGSYEGTFK